MAKTITQDEMNHLYYDINPKPHSEKAYQVPPDPAPPIAAQMTVAGTNGKLTVLVTTLYNRSGTAGVKYGTKAGYAVWTKKNLEMILVCEGEGILPYRDDITLSAGNYWIQPLTPNTMAKLLPSGLAV